MVTGYTSGVFDLFHIGHLKIIRRAKEQCDYLIVGVSTDELVLTQKKVKLVNPYVERAEIIRALKYVDRVVPQESYNKVDAWKSHKYDRMFVGSDWKGTSRWNKYEEEFKKIGVEILYFEYTSNVSSTSFRKLIEDNYCEVESQ